uniref:Kazal-like domain-containing protein n=1 Tax=Ceratitis capitata TaxID=7213 RepID=W8C4G4_CERCA
MLTLKKVLFSLIFCFLLSVISAKVETKKAQSLSNAIHSQVKNITAPHSPTKTCDLQKKCVVNETTVPLCLYDADEGCIRKYASKCHLDIAACKAGRTLNDYNNEYCAMDTFICEEGYERWTIFFGYEKA